MAGALHLLTHEHAGLAGRIIEGQVAAGDCVTVVWLAASPLLALPPGVTVRSLNRDLTYAQLLDLVFDADHVIAW